MLITARALRLFTEFETDQSLWIDIMSVGKGGGSAEIRQAFSVNQYSA